MKKICVLGSINIDMVTRTSAFPLPGQTVEGTDFQIFPGGKGANQAVAAGRLGADVTFLGKVGNDVFAETALGAMREAGVDTRCIQRADTSTGVAAISVSMSGENSIIVVPGANGLVDIAYVQENISAIENADILMLQLEVPMETVEWAANFAQAKGKTVILDPAPAKQLPLTVLKCCDIITPNETELKIITGRTITSLEETIDAARELIGAGVGMVVHKCGKAGAYVITKDRVEYIPEYPVVVVDTTAAGDSFNAGLAVALGQGKTALDGARFANIVAALSVTKAGAQSAMPTLAEVTRLIEENGGN